MVERGDLNSLKFKPETRSVERDDFLSAGRGYLQSFRFLGRFRSH
jgi:hypothetical protein